MFRWLIALLQLCILLRVSGDTLYLAYQNSTTGGVYTIINNDEIIYNNPTRELAFSDDNELLVFVDAVTGNLTIKGLSVVAKSLQHLNSSYDFVFDGLDDIYWSDTKSHEIKSGEFNALTGISDIESFDNDTIPDPRFMAFASNDDILYYSYNGTHIKGKKTEGRKEVVLDDDVGGEITGIAADEDDVYVMLLDSLGDCIIDKCNELGCTEYWSTSELSSCTGLAYSDSSDSLVFISNLNEVFFISASTPPVSAPTSSHTSPYGNLTAIATQPVPTVEPTIAPVVPTTEPPSVQPVASVTPAVTPTRPPSTPVFNTTLVEIFDSDEFINMPSSFSASSSGVYVKIQYIKAFSSDIISFPSSIDATANDSPVLINTDLSLTCTNTAPYDGAICFKVDFKLNSKFAKLSGTIDFVITLDIPISKRAIVTVPFSIQLTAANGGTEPSSSNTIPILLGVVIPIILIFIIAIIVLLILIKRTSKRKEPREVGSDYDNDDEVNIGVIANDMNRENTKAELMEGSDNYYDYGEAHIIGRRDAMEDDSASLLAFAGNEQQALFGVFDGHSGIQCANFLAKFLPKNIAKHPSLDSDTRKALHEAFVETDEVFLSQAKSNMDLQSVGSTCIVCLVRGDKVYVANTGDCRAILCQGSDTVVMSRDHKASDPEEKERVEAAGGMILFGRIFGKLAVARAFGDMDSKEKPGVVIADPEIKAFDLKRGDSKFMVVACDGLWDTLKNDDVIEMVKTKLKSGDSPSQIAKHLILQAYKEGSTDNISCTVVVFKDIKPYSE